MPIATARPSTLPPPSPGTAPATAAQATPPRPAPRVGPAGPECLQTTTLEKTDFLVKKTKGGREDRGAKEDDNPLF